MKRFQSGLAAELKAFLVFKRALGLSYGRAEFILGSFDRFAAEAERVSKPPRLDVLILSWLGREPHTRKPVSVSFELSVLRQLYIFLQREGRRRLREPLWPKLPAKSTYAPRVFTKAEVLLLLQATKRLRPLQLQRLVYRTLLLVLYCTGLRFGEAVRLRVQDVDLRRGTLFVARSKGRARWVPCHHSLVVELQRYLAARRAYARSSGITHDRVFINSMGAALSTKAASDNVRRILRRAGFKSSKGRVGPRPYDMRHTFAVHRLTLWYRKGVDLQARLPWLSAYMGHDDLLGTETYLHTTPELLGVAVRRFHRRVRGRRKAL
jgi:integrase/recombinase XerD